MVLGFTVVNTQKDVLIRNMSGQLSDVMSILFILFFTLAGAHLHITLLPSLGILGIVYVIFRSLGKIIGARIGALVGTVHESVKKYAGIGILSQAGVAIGLALIVKHEFAGLGKVIRTVDGREITSGDHIGMAILTTVTVTCIIFEIIGPILTKIALQKAGEIDRAEEETS
jgi:Kef-type K+ transport system membrane component KefB